MSDQAVGETLNLIVRLPPNPSAVRVARHMVRSLQRWIPDDQVERGELIVSEIVTNAVRYSAKDSEDLIELELTATRRSLDGAIRDSGQPFTIPPAPPPGPQIGGFGLHIVRQLADSLSVERTETGNCVRFRLGKCHGRA